MALVNQSPNDRKRVKVYELRNNDWFDLGTGFCTGRVIDDESKVYVESEDQPDRVILDTKISKEDGYQKQQDTLIIWAGSHGADMALSFQEADCCKAIWEFISQVQTQLLSLGAPDDALSDDAMEGFTNPVMLPPPELVNLADIDQIMRSASATPQGRDSLSKFIIGEDYVRKLVPLVEVAEDLEALPELHRLSNIMKILILLNDTHIIEHVVSDSIVLGVVGALEYDTDFPSHKANHRQYLKDGSRFKEVVPIDDPEIEKKIHSTWRLQYLKDVVLARILDDPTFSVLNSLIFFNQVEIVSHLQGNAEFLRELFSIVESPKAETKKRKEAVCFIQQCCAIAKNLQGPARATLYNNFVDNGILDVITFAVLHPDASIRVAGTDILVAMIDHDPNMMRSYIFKAMDENKTPLTDTLINLLLIEDDLGVRAQVADAIKVLLDPQPSLPPAEQMTPENIGSETNAIQRPQWQDNYPPDVFIRFYQNAALKLFQPLRDLEKRESVHDLTLSEIFLFSHLVEIIMFFIRQPVFRARYSQLIDGLPARVAQLLSCQQKYMKLTALKFFRVGLSLQENWFNSQIVKGHLFEPILNIVYETMPRDNLLNSVCLELFEFVKRENIKPIITHVVENYRDKLQEITYVDVFQNFVLRYDQMQGYRPDMEGTMFGQEDDSSHARPRMNGHGRWHVVREMDPAEEEYFNTSDDEDELSAKPRALLFGSNGVSSGMKRLVDYPDDDEETMELKSDNHSAKSRTGGHDSGKASSGAAPFTPRQSHSFYQSPPERLSEKRRREEDEEDELGKLSLTKRRSSSVASVNSAGSSSSSSSNSGTPSNFLRRKKSFSSSKELPGSRKIAISLAVKAPIKTEHPRDEGG